MFLYLSQHGHTSDIPSNRRQRQKYEEETLFSCDNFKNEKGKRITTLPNAQDAHWQTIERDYHFGYSAFVEVVKQHTIIRVVGMHVVRSRPRLDLYCQIWFDNQVQPTVVFANVDILTKSARERSVGGATSARSSNV